MTEMTLCMSLVLVLLLVALVMRVAVEGREVIVPEEDAEVELEGLVMERGEVNTAVDLGRLVKFAGATPAVNLCNQPSIGSLVSAAPVLSRPFPALATVRTLVTASPRISCTRQVG